MIKMSSRPPIKSADDFIEAAEGKLSQKNDKELPWLKEGVRADLKKGVNVFLHEPSIMKLKFISENSSYSQQSFARESLEKAIDDKISELLS